MNQRIERAMFIYRRSHAAITVWILIVAKNLFRSVQLVDASSSPHLALRVRRTQEEESAAYTKCFDVLDSVTGDGITLSQSQYVEFLSQMVEGDDSVAPSIGFEDLDAVYILIFYMTACEDASKCTPSMSPQSIPIGDTTDPSDNLRLLCRAVLREGETKVDATFSYSIQYDTSALEDSKIGECLSTATVNVLLDLFGCEPTMMRQRRRREEQTIASSLAFHGFLELITETRRDLQVGSVIFSADEDCPYMLSSSVERLTELGKWETTNRYNLV